MGLFIKEARYAGFCPGVRRAVDTVYKLLDTHPDARIVTLGALIHNPIVIGELASRGVRALGADEIEAWLSEGEGCEHIVVVRAHGMTLETEQMLSALAEKDARLTVIDCTCGFVKNIHKIAADESRPYIDAPDEAIGIIFGDPEHPEVQGIASRFACQTKILETAHETEEWVASAEAQKFLQKRVIYVSQTTQKLAECKISQKFFEKLYTNAKIFDTICNVTENRQTETESISRMADVMLVIGGRGSSNTQKLYDICKRNCPETYFIEGPTDVPRHLLLSAKTDKPTTVGITAGASTPDSIIEEVKRIMSENVIIEENFAQMLDESFKTLNTGDVVKGVVTSISQNEIHVDIGSKVTGILSFNDITDDPSVDVENMFHVGDEVEAIAVRVSDLDGVATLSKKRIDNANNWNEIVTASTTGDILTGKVVEALEKGVIINIKGIRVFVPASHSGLPREADLSTLVGTAQRVKIIDLNEQRRRAVASIREVLRAERKEKEAAVWASIEVGKEYDGVVKSFQPYGAFVDLGGVDGMVHTSELSWKHIRHPSEVISIGDTIHVFVIAVDHEAKRISLGYKTEEMNPWTKFTAQYAVGDVASVKIVSTMPFGAFAEIIDGVDGLIHISQLAAKRVNNPTEVVEKGQIVEAKIVGIDEENHKVSLSMRALIEETEETEEVELEAEVAEEASEEVEAVAAEAEEAFAVEEAPAAEETVAEEAADAE